MNHSITVGGLLLTLGIVAGCGAALFGLLEMFGGMMSDDPSLADQTSSQGCIVLIVGIVVLVGCILKAAL